MIKPELQHTLNQAQSLDCAVNSGTQKPVILVVDDDPDICFLIRELLSAAGYEVHTANTVGQAKSLLKEIPLSILLTDYTMPEGGGLDLLEFAMQERLQFNRIFGTVVMSGHSESALSPKTLTHAFTFLYKPFRSAQLIAACALELQKAEALRNSN